MNSDYFPYLDGRQLWLASMTAMSVLGDHKSAMQLMDLNEKVMLRGKSARREKLLFRLLKQHVLNGARSGLKLRSGG
jgi:hypothetical protein